MLGASCAIKADVLASIRVGSYSTVLGSTNRWTTGRAQDADAFRGRGCEHSRRACRLLSKWPTRQSCEHPTHGSQRMP